MVVHYCGVSVLVLYLCIESNRMFLGCCALFTCDPSQGPKNPHHKVGQPSDLRSAPKDGLMGQLLANTDYYALILSSNFSKYALLTTNNLLIQTIKVEMKPSLSCSVYQLNHSYTQYTACSNLTST